MSRTPRRVAAAAAVLGATLLLGSPAQAVSVLDPVPTTVTWAAPGATTALTGLSVASGNPSEGTITVTLLTSAGELSLGTTAGITAGYQVDLTGDAVLTFTGPFADVNAALATVSLTLPGDASGTTTVTFFAHREDTSYTYNPRNGHFYKAVSGTITWTDAKAAAEGSSFQGMTGYLVTITDDYENELVKSRVQGASNVWTGGRAVEADGVRTWVWDGGPEANQSFARCVARTVTDTAASFPCQTPSDSVSPDLTFSSWFTGEPNDYHNVSNPDGEAYAVTNWSQGAVGKWNDIRVDHNLVGGYVVEFGGVGTSFLPTETMTLTVAASDPTPTPTPTATTPSTPTTPSTLASTGADTAGPQAALAGVVLLAGAGLVLLGRRRATQD